MTPPLLLGVDLGTSSVKALVMAPDGEQLAAASVEYPVEVPQPGWAEQDPEGWIQATSMAVRTALARGGMDPAAVQAVGIAGQMHGTVCVDRRGRALRPAIIWPDQRSQRQVAAVLAQVGSQQLGAWTGNPLATGFMLSSWLWVRENEPALAGRTNWLLLPKDYLRYRLVGELGSEPSDAGSSLLFDPFARRWSDQLLNALKIRPDLLPSIHPSAEVAGGLRQELAEITGLKPGTPVVYGGSDQACQALGHGVVTPGDVSSTIGTGGQILAPLRKPVSDPQLRLHLFCHVLPDLWHQEAATLSAGLSLRWLRDQLGLQGSYQELSDLAAQAPAGAEGLIFLPHLVGERTPHMDPSARGAFIGLTLRHHRQHLVRAVMEGVVFSLRQGLELMRSLGTPIHRIFASGGAIRHPLWLQLQADIFARPIHQTTTKEAAAVGAALLAGVGIGLYPDAITACRNTIHLEQDPVQPRPDHADRYAAAYQAYCRLYPALRSLDSDADPAARPPTDIAAVN